MGQQVVTLLLLEVALTLLVMKPAQSYLMRLLAGGSSCLSMSCPMEIKCVYEWPGIAKSLCTVYARHAKDAVSLLVYSITCGLTVGISVFPQLDDSVQTSGLDFKK